VCLIELILRSFSEKPDLQEKLAGMIGTGFLWFLWVMTWICFGIIAFGVVFQWILLLVLPKAYYPYAMNGFIVAWCIFGVWYWFFRKEKP